MDKQRYTQHYTNNRAMQTPLVTVMAKIYQLVSNNDESFTSNFRWT